MSILLIDNFDSFTYNLYQALQSLTEHKVIIKRNNAITIEEITQLKPAAIVLSPGPGHPGNASDFGVCAEILRVAASLGCPILGVCLGHQGIAQMFGGDVVRAPHIVHGKTSEIEIVAQSKLLQSIESGFKAMRYHSLVVKEETLPNCLRITARDKSHNLIMAMEHTELPVFGVQFHPESIGTPDGLQILRNFVSLC